MANVLAQLRGVARESIRGAACGISQRVVAGRTSQAASDRLAIAARSLSCLGGCSSGAAAAGRSALTGAAGIAAARAGL